MSMPRSNCNPAPTSGDSSDNESCPKCGALMEPIDSHVEGLPLRRLQLCPSCSLVTWEDENGFQIRQGIPVRNQTENPV